MQCGMHETERDGQGVTLQDKKNLTDNVRQCTNEVAFFTVKLGQQHLDLMILRLSDKNECPINVFIYREMIYVILEIISLFHSQCMCMCPSVCFYYLISLSFFLLLN